MILIFIGISGKESVVESVFPENGSRIYETSFGFVGSWRGVDESGSDFQSGTCVHGRVSQEVLKNYFHMAGVKVLNSIWMDQMAILLYSEQEDAFTELTGCTRRARDYLAGERQIPVACGVSGTCSSPEELPEAYEEAASYIRDYYGDDVHQSFMERTEGMKQICQLEEKISTALAAEEREDGEELLTELIEELERHLMYQDLAVKLNFGRSLMTIIRNINQMPGIRVNQGGCGSV